MFKKIFSFFTVITLLILVIGSIVYLISKRESVSYPSFYFRNITMTECKADYIYFEKSCLALVMDNSFICDEINIPEKRKMCQKNIAFFELFKSRDISLCEVLEDPERKEKCINVVSVCEDISCCDTIQNENDKNYCTAMISNDTKVCDQFEHTIDKFQCIAMLTKDSNYCKEGMKHFCADIVLTEQATFKRNISMCGGITEKSKRDICYDLIYETQAIAALNNSLCNNIKNKVVKERCVTSIKEIQKKEKI